MTRGDADRFKGIEALFLGLLEGDDPGHAALARHLHGELQAEQRFPGAEWADAQDGTPADHVRRRSTLRIGRCERGVGEHQSPAVEKRVKARNARGEAEKM